MSPMAGVWDPGCRRDQRPRVPTWCHDRGMEIAAVVLAVFLGLFMVGSAVGKLTRAKPVVDNLTKAGVPLTMFPMLATIQLVGALGLFVGIWMPWAGVAAGVGFFLYFVLGAAAHVRAGDAKGATPAVVLAVIALAEAVLRATA